MTDLRSKVIRLAHQNPELRPHLLPLLKESKTASPFPRVKREIEEDYKRKAITSGERDELLEAIGNAETERDAQKIVGDHRKGRVAVDESSVVVLGAAEKKLKAISQKYKKYERKDPDQPPKNNYGQPWSPRGGMFEVFKNLTFGRNFALGVKIGSKFAEPAWYKYPDRDGWEKARAEQKSVANKAKAEVKKVLESIPGGYVEEKDGSAYTVVGWFAK